MRFLRRHRFVLLFLAALVFCSVMVIRQFEANRAKHLELREAFILLSVKGYPQAQRLYQRLLRDLEKQPNRTLLEDFQRTIMLVDPSTQHPENLVWKYHWSVSNELERRAQSALSHALKLLDEE